jgi:hypothetical protein
VLDAFLLDYRDWDLWNYVGSKTRKISREDWLSKWRKFLAKCFPAIADFHEEVRAAFWRNAGGGQLAGMRAFETKAHRAFVDEIVQHLLHCASALLAIAIEETAPSTLVARFQDRALCEVKESKLEANSNLRDSISEKLASAFAGASIDVQIEEVQA